MKKKILMYGLVTVLSLSMLSGCGSKKSSEKGGHKVDKSIKEVAENVAKNVEDIDSMKLGLKGNIDMTADNQGIKYSIKGNGELNGVFKIDVPGFNLDGKVSYELNQGANKLSGEYSVEAYGETEGDTMTNYWKTNVTDWECESVDVSEYLESVSEFKEELEEFAQQIRDMSDKEIEDEFGEYLKLEDTTKVVNGKECYVISADMDINDIKDLDKDILKTSEDVEFDKLDFLYGICIDTDTYMPVKVYFDIAAHGTNEYVEYTINDMSFEFNFVANSGKVESVPKDAKETAEKNDGPSGILGAMKPDDDDIESDDDDKKDYGKVDTKYIPKSFKLDGKECKFGDKVSVMLDAGYEIEVMDGNEEKIKADSSEPYYLKKSGSNNSFLVYVDNNTNTDIDVKDAVISGISVMESDGVTLELDNGITLESNISDVKEVYKNQKSSYEYEGEYISTITYEDKDHNEVNYDFDAESGKLDQIEIFIYTD